MVAVILNGTVSKDEGRGDGRRWSVKGDSSWKCFRTQYRDDKRTQQRKLRKDWRKLGMEEGGQGRRGGLGTWTVRSSSMGIVDCAEYL